ncbi:circadian clock protein KaiC [Flavobacterium sp. GT3R68]|uniref:circadian clock protein KaiC n=1 Tax=Flavobacterium sp. GT3R68 TaxID=2594437 RepID=UPI000F882601|nr:circadian clock protein KaiC [Flavobacterium sp. GT3R68]RTY89830.1 circadian clock protein KaiC [Flavobacterium sp. GSN2]TRW89809.1 circadian clock protein KaiC [Flavobacterium sp. GT3R68]
MKKDTKTKTNSFTFPKSPTGILGLDDITTGGLPKNRPTLLLGNAGCGKTVLSMEFLLNGIRLFDESGVYMTFEEKTEELVTNVSSLGYELDKFIANNKLYLDSVKINPDEVQQTGKYDLEGLFIRLGLAIDKVKAKRVVLDSLDALFAGYDIRVLRQEFKRLVSWLKEKKVTAIITGEIGRKYLSRHGLEEYIADCVIVVDNRVTNQVSTRRLRIVKYRGSFHGNNEYPFTIDDKGITVLPLVSEIVNQKVSTDRISSGIEPLDEMLGKKGFYLGSSVLISGTAGTGKTSVAASFALSVCEAKKRSLYCAFEEAPNQIIRNMKSIGLNLKPFVTSGILTFYYSRPTLQNLEMHFIAIRKLIKELKPTVVILDPITNLMTEGPNSDIRSMLTRLVDYLKLEEITVLFTAAITVGSISRNPSDEGISSMVDTWVMVQDIEVEEERLRSICVMKSRGMSHSTSLRQFNISKKGITMSEIVRNVAEDIPGTKRTEKENKNISTSKN